MPKRAVVTIAHAALTEHRILVRPNEQLPEQAFQSSDPDSGLVRLTANPGQAKKAVPDIISVQAYAKLIHDGHDEFRPRMNDALDRLSRTAPNDPSVLSALARREVQKGTPAALDNATRYLNRVVKSDHAGGDDILLLSQLDSRANKHAEAIEVLKGGLDRNPYSPEFAESIAAEYYKIGDYRNVLDIARRCLELFPDDKTLRALMNQVKSATLDGLSSSHSP
jgi:tetratricopeptide (TPR) repeat protein